MLFWATNKFRKWWNSFYITFNKWVPDKCSGNSCDAVCQCSTTKVHHMATCSFKLHAYTFGNWANFLIFVNIIFYLFICVFEAMGQNIRLIAILQFLSILHIFCSFRGVVPWHEQHRHLLWAWNRSPKCNIDYTRFTTNMGKLHEYL